MSLRMIKADEKLVVSSGVSMLVPLTIGKLIDFFSTGAVCPFSPWVYQADGCRRCSLACRSLLLRLHWPLRSVLGLFAMLVCLIALITCQS
jgi:hypothetical protein